MSTPMSKTLTQASARLSSNRRSGTRFFQVGGQIVLFSCRSSLDRVCAADPECVPDDGDYGDYGAYSGVSSIIVSIFLLPLLVVHWL